MLADRLYLLLPKSVRRAQRKLLMQMMAPRLRKHFARFISPGDLVFDVGANLGDLTRIFLDLGADVICVEPQPACIKVLKQRFKNNKRVTIVEKGISFEKGVLPFYISSENHATSSFSRRMITQGRFAHRNWDKTVEVPVTTLQKVVEKYGSPAFCKIDVEAFEDKVLLGLDSPIHQLSFEFHQEFMEDAKRCVEMLSGFGKFVFNYSLFISYSLQSEQWLTADQLFDELRSKGNGIFRKKLSGDIYARFTQEKTADQSANSS